jgi:integrase/recombinase XerD
MPSSITTVKLGIESIPNENNRRLVYKFLGFMETTDTSENYRRGNLIVVVLYAKFLGDKNLSEVNRKDDVIGFLDTKKKDIILDPDKRWIRTWNDYFQRIKYFMRWLHNGAPDAATTDSTIPITDWHTPNFVQIRPKKTNRLSPYSDSEIWERDELLTVVKYEPLRRNKVALTLCWDLNARPHEVVLLKIKNLRLGPRYGEGEIPHESKTGSGPLLLTCSFPYVRDWLNEHPFKNEPNARVICNLLTGGAVKADTLSSIMKKRKRIIRLIETGPITDEHERKKLERITKTKKWNPYCIRHSAITSDSDYLPEFALKKKVRWSMNSRQPSRYIKTRMGNDLKQKILAQNGIIPETEARPDPTVVECARCRLVNCIENKFCSECSYPLTPLAFEEIKAAEDIKVRTLEEKYEQDMKSVKEQIGSIFKVLEQLRDQKDINMVASTLYRSGQLKIHQ